MKAHPVWCQLYLRRNLGQRGERVPDSFGQIQFFGTAVLPRKVEFLSTIGRGERGRLLRRRPVTKPRRVGGGGGPNYRVVQLNFTPEIKAFYMRFERFLSIFSVTSLKPHIQYFHFQCKIPAWRKTEKARHKSVENEQSQRTAILSVMIGNATWVSLELLLAFFVTAVRPA